MFLKSLSLQNFRSYKKADFDFSSQTTLIIGPNTAGKSNLIEAIFYLARGASFRIDKDEDVVRFGESLSRIKANLDDKDLEVIIAQGGFSGKSRGFKKYLVNKVSKRKTDFIGNFFAVLFAPNDLEIIIGSPSKRRDFLNNILSQADHEYRRFLSFYEKGLRARNRLLHKSKETGRRDDREFAYWDNLLITQGQKITKKREEFLQYIQETEKEIFEFNIDYDQSTISRDRLEQYRDAEVGAGVTLVGPHRDDLSIRINTNSHTNEYELRDIKHFGSRGQQRLAILQLKLLELMLIQEKTSIQPVLLLDDIFSELDENHIDLLLKKILFRREFEQQGQVIITTTHKEFVPDQMLKKAKVIRL
jgi:DNA replication and repair protein RecF